MFSNKNNTSLQHGLTFLLTNLSQFLRTDLPSSFKRVNQRNNHTATVILAVFFSDSSLLKLHKSYLQNNSFTKERKTPEVKNIQKGTWMVKIGVRLKQITDNELEKSRKKFWRCAVIRDVIVSRDSSG